MHPRAKGRHMPLLPPMLPRHAASFLPEQAFQHFLLDFLLEQVFQKILREVLEECMCIQDEFASIPDEKTMLVKKSFLVLEHVCSAGPFGNAPGVAQRVQLGVAFHALYVDTT